MGSDIIFLHAPSVYDFRKKPIFYGPVSDVIPSSPVFEMYPVGFMTISSHLEAAGFRTRIVNIAVQMLQSDRFDAEERIRKLDAPVFAIDLHWMPHAHGAIELAKIVKKHHPEAKVEFGGLTSSYFYEELIQRPEVDLVMRGDTTEVPTVMMMEALQRGGDLSKVPNLVWKDSDGRVHDNGLTYSLESLDEVMFDYGTMIKSVLRNRDISGALPWFGWDKLPLTSVFTVRGCSINCAECGGSHFANGKVVCRRRPAKSFHTEDGGDCHDGHDHGESGCGCGHRHRGIIADAAAHTVKVFAFIFAVTLALNIVIHTVGQDALGSVLGDIPVLGEIVAGLIGLIPNCAASVIISQLYLDGVIGAGAMMSGLLVSAGAGVLVLFEENRSPKSNALILAVLYGLGVAWGLLVEVSGVVF